MTRSVPTALLLLAAAGTALAENWPAWRGPAGDGVSAAAGVPAEWGEGKNVLWKLDLPGMGSSTPAVWGDRLFVTSEDGDDIVAVAVSTAGKELWRKKLGVNTRRRARKDEGNEASPSCSTDGRHVWAYAGTGELACFDVDGNEAWRFNVQDRYGKFDIQFGMHTTPVLDNGRLYLQLIHSAAALVVALDARTGSEVWKVKRPSDGRAECEHSYASPALWRKGADAYLVVHGNDYATAHRLTDGSEVWRVGGLNPEDRYNPTLRFVASPAATPDLIVVPSAKNGPVVGLKPDAKGLVTAGSPHEKWRLAKDTPDVPTPLVVNGLVYLCRENGNLICLDAETGKQHYNERTHNARHRASPVYADGKVILTARDGRFTVVRFGPKFEVLASNRLPDEFAASPALADGRVYLRGFKALYCVGK